MRGPAKLLKADGSVIDIAPKNGRCFTLEELQTYVGGNIQIAMPPSRHGALLVINEEGKFDGLPRNEFATKVYMDPGGIGDWVAGDAVLCHQDQVE